MRSSKRISDTGFWNSVENQRLFLENLQKKFGIKDPQDWGKIVIEDFRKSGGDRLLANYGYSIYSVLKSVYEGGFQLV